MRESRIGHRLDVSRPFRHKQLIDLAVGSGRHEQAGQLAFEKLRRQAIGKAQRCLGYDGTGAQAPYATLPEHFNRR